MSDYMDTAHYRVNQFVSGVRVLRGGGPVRAGSFMVELEDLEAVVREWAAMREALERSLDWLASYPGGGTMRPGGPYEQARAALGNPSLPAITSEPKL